MIREQIGIIRIIPGTDERKVCDHTIRMRKAVCLGMDPTTDGFSYFIFNDPPRSSRKWKKEYNARTSSERCNKREKIDYKLEDGRHRSTKMWYCRLFAIMMCQHLDAWINQSHIVHVFL